ncbi:DNA cytosine methyltransferase [Pontibacter sp. BT310]|uniref:DNA (cytosine-5-)-methyltransferase n=1 Tax=Pontibacter populi TaxID=890055 RepID=A0ABS6XCY2_9BACT|nr:MULTISPECIES: DNA cytosine methyltransferase [Pontibacter]MBJ6118997.1 DNA cytosine methyltransferase [Pontibacter sp. BT310]MBR0571425.1 DNA cytosine methyltransferase [Microvirga sp. STS03]MBW3365851.1 DNA cytosine methyltransferase [Pontibacter populi]
MSHSKLTVVDFFCGAGGFSEGFRQQGFDIILGIDSWQPAIDTFNHNFRKGFQPKNILDFDHSIEEIEQLPDSDILLGSPPCVSFSTSNKSGKADKTLGIKLTECFLRVVAIKKHKPESILKAWFMENVKNSKRYLPTSYSFEDLRLSEWAEKNGIDPKMTAITLEGNSSIINSADYGSLQSRNRLITGEVIRYGKFLVPTPTHRCPSSKTVNRNGIELQSLPNFRTLGDFLNNFPSPFEKESQELIKDPSYDLSVEKTALSDHFYDTGIHSCEWRSSKYLKLNHPFMGRMSFPESPNKPSRTVTATSIGSSREALIFKTEIKREGDGEYRVPTVRESAVLMGFPLTYQFVGSEGIKRKLVGNAVCPSVSSALAKEVRRAYGLSNIEKPHIATVSNLKGINNLNTFDVKEFGTPPKRKAGSRFRRHPFKKGNMTVALSNYDITGKAEEFGTWRSTVFYGTGEGFGSFTYDENFYTQLEPIIRSEFSDGEKFIATINNGFSEKIASKDLLQEMYEKKFSTGCYLEPTLLIEELARIIEDFDTHDELFVQSTQKIFEKPIVPKGQLYSLYAINKIVSIANNN